MSSRTQLIGRLHGMKRQLGLDDETYRAKLELITGKASAKDCDQVELLKAVEGFRRSGVAHVQGLPQTAQVKMLQALWISLYNLGLVQDRSDHALMAFIKRQSGIEHARFLQAASDVKKVAEALKSWLAREGQVDFKTRRGVATYINLPAYRVVEAQWLQLTGSSMGFNAWATLAVGKPFEKTVNADWGKVSKKMGAELRKKKGLAS